MSDRLALIIANSEFDDPKLSRLVAPSHDAESLAEVLRDPAIGGFDVTLLVDEREPVVRRRVARLYHRRKRGDLLLLYYSGHGVRDERSGELYLATRDTEMDIASATAIGAAFVRGQMDKSNSQRKVVVLDCCHSGAFAKAKAALGSSAGTREAFAGNGYGRVILTASNAVEYAWEGDKLLGKATRSVFTHFLVQGLQTGAADLNGDGQVSLDELYDYVYEQVITSGRSKQTPQKWAQKVEGRIIIARNPRPVVKPAELPLELRQAIESPSPRLDVLTITSPIHLELVRVPASEFLMGSNPVSSAILRISKDEEAYSDEQPQCRVQVSEFYIGKYPVTNAQYAAFVRATKHEAPKHWEKGRIPSGRGNHPVVYVSWHDAVAFCEWLSQETGRNFRLPTEAKWEKAARGTDSRIYPWGNTWDAKRCHSSEGLTRTITVWSTAQVGKYSPSGDSPYGAAGMAGNVWEWCNSLYKSYPYKADDGREDLKAEGRRVMRGGSFRDRRRRVRCAYRGGDDPGGLGRLQGFRLVASPVASEL
jgi:formylglycine-generating enzyme required for sulfatase activity